MKRQIDAEIQKKNYEKELLLCKKAGGDIERYRRYDGARRLHHLAGSEQQVRPDGIRHHLPQAALFGGDADRQRRGGLLIRNQEHPLRVYRPGGQAQTADGRGAHGDTQQHGLPYRPAHGGQIPRDARNPGGPAPQGALKPQGCKGGCGRLQRQPRCRQALLVKQAFFRTP